MARKRSTAQVMPDDYTITAIPKQMVAMMGEDERLGDLEKFADARATGNRDASLGIIG